MRKKNDFERSKHADATSAKYASKTPVEKKAAEKKKNIGPKE